MRNFWGYDEIYSTAQTPSYLAVGTGTTDPADGDTALETEVFRNVLTGRTPADKKITLQLLLTADEANGNNLTEAGLFPTSVGGTLFARATFNQIIKTTSISVTFNWEMTFSEG